MDFYEMVDQVASLMQQRGRVSYSALKLQFKILCHFYRGHTTDRTADYIRRRFGVSAHPRTISC